MRARFGIIERGLRRVRGDKGYETCMLVFDDCILIEYAAVGHTS